MTARGNGTLHNLMRRIEMCVFTTPEYTKEKSDLVRRLEREEESERGVQSAFLDK